MSFLCNIEDLISEGDVEMKLLSPLLTESDGLGYYPEDVKNKSYMTPTDIDKGAGKTVGYYPDYTILLNALPVMIVEAKKPDEKIENAFKEAQLYAHATNKRYPSNLNPVQIVVASNGLAVMYGMWDSEDTITIELKDLIPGSAVFEAFRTMCNRTKLVVHAKRH